MPLFKQEADSSINLLPYDGTVQFYGEILTPLDADRYYEDLLESIAWQHDEAMIFGRHITTKRQVAWYGDQAFSYTYSKITKQALPWTASLLALKALVESYTGEIFNSCLLNLYHDGNEGMAWHSDGEVDLKPNGAIASLSLGAERRFLFKHKQSGAVVETILPHGSLLVMKDETQTHWLHRLPPMARIKTPRVNLTFRTIVH
ncbi:alpha-ketoglutarate-dependent dioxygenase AlkB [Ignatzschineria rhizosphaerae]|uniref:Alpha-ketoglutarate-dependent dioxygenase AlkB n=1 Tax=Ignatzschineria rhizosphaerae TaxID=2923279 RepID=A0ABY3X2N4_9GAMM|nr:alpha-ketoglutarate-dependent dioxygenase AlkB [Ignatzschineria rhizosphaerae]UNM97153.1 alpha-ketoglutarate-dependent dioxygenase AlkB [Ignatzschineria rhizosphaerae]